MPQHDDSPASSSRCGHCLTGQLLTLNNPRAYPYCPVSLHMPPTHAHRAPGPVTTATIS